MRSVCPTSSNLVSQNNCTTVDNDITQCEAIGISYMCVQLPVTDSLGRTLAVELTADMVDICGHPSTATD